jgi:hypothetical protein
MQEISLKKELITPMRAIKAACALISKAIKFFAREIRRLDDQIGREANSPDTPYQ